MGEPVTAFTELHEVIEMIVFGVAVFVVTLGRIRPAARADRQKGKNATGLFSTRLNTGSDKRVGVRGNVDIGRPFRDQRKK